MSIEKKSEGKLKRDQSRYETLALWSGIAVIAGLALEVWLAIEFRPQGQNFTETWGPVGADVLVAVGVFFEILFGRWALHHGGELQQRAERALADATEKAGQAIERAATAELQTEKLRAEVAWRRLSDDQAKKISGVLSDKPKCGLRIIHAEDPEARAFASDIAQVFRKCGWKVLFITRSAAESFSGMIIPIYAPPDLDACGLVRIAISAAGIEYRGGSPPGGGAGMFATSGDNVSSPCGTST